MEKISNSISGWFWCVKKKMNKKTLTVRFNSNILYSIMKLNIEKIDERLRELGMSRYALAVKMEMKTRSQIYMLLQGENMTLKTVQGLANALEIPSKDLLIS